MKTEGEDDMKTYRKASKLVELPENFNHGFKRTSWYICPNDLNIIRIIINSTTQNQRDTSCHNRVLHILARFGEH